MLKQNREPELQIDQDLNYEKRKWVVERVNWVIMSVLILAGLLGFLGNGPFSSTSATNTTASVTVDYDRFLHLQKTTTIRIHVAPEMVQEGTLRLWFDQDFLSEFKVEKIIPPPHKTEVGKHRFTFIFQVSGTEDPFLFILHVQPESPGLLKGKLGVGDLEAVQFQQLVYP